MNIIKNTLKPIQKLFNLLTIILILPILISCNDQATIINQGNQTTIRIIIDIKGEIRLPGMYEFNREIHLFEVIELAGGVTGRADLTNTNLLLLIKSSQSITISSIKTSDAPQLININYAQPETLATLPKIGLSKAQKIVEYRQANGFFLQTSDIMKVSGIGEEIYKAIKDLITI